MPKDPGKQDTRDSHCNLQLSVQEEERMEHCLDLFEKVPSCVA
jgi:hypothetical protein